MKNYKLLVLITLVTFLSSCSELSDVRFISPQPDFLERLTSIPQRFQGTFLIDKDTIQVTEYTIDGCTINSDSLIVKGWGNYLFVNQIQESYYSLTCAKAVNVWNNEKITLQYFSIADDIIEDFEKFRGSAIDPKTKDKEIEEFMIANSSLNIIEYDTIVEKFIIDKLTINQFQTMLNKSETVKVTRIE
jgi:hypothetical protein